MEIKALIPSNAKENERGWAIICIEGYCGKDWEYIQTSCPYNYEFDADKDPADWDKVPNPDYNPEAKIPEDPPYCEKQICFACLSNKCQYFAYAEAGKEEEECLEWMGDKLEEYVDVWMECELKDYVEVDAGD
jgi:hypothetical protein